MADSRSLKARSEERRPRWETAGALVFLDLPHPPRTTHTLHPQHSHKSRDKSVAYGTDEALRPLRRNSPLVTTQRCPEAFVTSLLTATQKVSPHATHNPHYGPNEL